MSGSGECGMGKPCRIVAQPSCMIPELPSVASYARFQGLTLAHLSAQLEPCLTPENTLHTPKTPLTRVTQPLCAPPIPYKALKLS
jgi:hypothetical protein